jgi:predicted RNA-binding Zn-ribbon protein involved in translation (DUF1610 family)
MGLFNHSKKQSPTHAPQSQPVVVPPEVKDERVRACPSCGVELKKIPGAATNCPHCGAMMFVRTDPRDNTRRVVTAEGAQEVGSWEFVKAKRDREAVTREKLAVKFRMSPESVSQSDVQWSILVQEAIEAMKHANWLDERFDQCRSRDALPWFGTRG